METPIRLTQYSHGAGCGCKIAPAVLEEILKGHISLPDNPALLVGNSSKDDAAVYDLGNGTALISTTDFFMPIVDDPIEFGRIAAANSISDIYAMGGKPLLAIAILGWPINKLPADIARQVIDGGKSICIEAGIPLAGGHSIDSPEPIFGLAVTGLLPIENLKRNDTAKEGDLLFLTKSLGVGIMTTAQKRGQLNEEDRPALIQQLTTLNRIGEKLGTIKGVNAMTDVTGFGLLGHLIEMAEGSGLSAEISYQALPKLNNISHYISQKIFPDAVTRNWSSYGTKVKFEKGVNVMEAFTLLPDPQTNGGLLIAVSPESAGEVAGLLGEFGNPIGKLVGKGEKVVVVGV
ncbi:MAG: selenide, water dikinase SelD [Sphingobacteriales bacterium 12-47-4]|nr:MAG: selenide, water dikinase SelD [Sphingobacteriales bacterium 12-47-4]